MNDADAAATDADAAMPTDADVAPKTAADYPDLRIETLVEGDGEPLERGDAGKFRYEGMLLDGTRFDTNIGNGREPFEVKVGSGSVIQGWDLGLVGMKKGEKRRIVIPSELGYGPRAQASIPANSTLVFYVDLVEVVESGS